MGSIRLRISVNDIATVLASYNVMKVKKSTTGQNGTYFDITSLTATPATLLASLQQSYNIAGKTLKLTRDSHGEVDILFPGIDLYSADQAAHVINDAVGVVIAANDGHGYLKLTSTATGTASKLLIGDGSANAAFGWADDTRNVGKEAYVVLHAGVSLYEFVDDDGEPGYYYKVAYHNTTNGLSSQDSPPFLGAAATMVGADKLAVAVINLVDGAGIAVPEQEVTFYPVHEPLQVDGFQVALSRKPLSVTTDNAGHAEVTLVRGLKVKVVFEGTGLIREIVVPNAASFDLLQLMGTAADPYSVKTLDLPAALRRTV